MHHRAREEARNDGTSGWALERWEAAVTTLAIVWLLWTPRAMGQELLCYEYATGDSGAAVAGGEDFDGDGRAEFLVGAPLAPSGGSVKCFSKNDGCCCVVRFTVTGGAPGEEFGAAIAVLSDLDGDGRGDFAVGAPRADAAGSESGRVSVFSGASGALLYSVPGNSAGDRFGTSLARAGDVDGDGIEDWIGGAPYSDLAGSNSGSAIVVSGRGGAILFRFDGEHAQDELGSSVAGAGDVDRDGRPDLIVGSPRADANGADSGRALVFSGSDGAFLHAVDGRAVGDQLGRAVAILDDLDDDGYADFVAGAPYEDLVLANHGSVRVYSGANGALLERIVGIVPELRLGASLSAAGDFDADGVGDFLAGGPGWSDEFFVPSGVWLYSGSTLQPISVAAQEPFHPSVGRAVAGVGDVDGDGRPEYLTGAPDYETGLAGGYDIGSYLFGRHSWPAWRTIRGDGYGEKLGSSVIVAGDVDLDGSDDLLVGSPGWGNHRPGRVQVLSGRTGDPLGVIEGEVERKRLGSSLARLGDLDGDGRDDWMLGAPSDVGLGQGYVRVVSSATLATLYTRIDGTDDGGFGTCGIRIPDSNGDGVEDFAVGDPVEARVHLLSGRAGDSLLVLAGPPGSRFGNTLCEVGDVDGDARPDWAVGEPGGGWGSGTPGSVHVFSGADARRIASWNGTKQTGEQFGYRAARVRDLDGDGIDELLVTSETFTAASLLSLGRRTVLRRWAWNYHHNERDLSVSAGDLDADGRDEVVIGVPWMTDWTDDGGTAHLIRVGSAGDFADQPLEGPWSSMSFASEVQVLSDLDGNGFPELAVGAPDEHLGAPFGGVLRIYRR